MRAVVDRNQATVGESIALQVTIDGGEGEVDLSGLVDFKTVSRGTSSSFQMINGRTSRQLIHNYVLIPLKAGNLTIPAIPVTIDGKIHYTTPIGVTVSREPPADSGQRDVYVTAEVSEPAPWVGQQFAYTFRLFNAVQVADAKFQAPEFNGFNAEELEDRQSHRTVVNGREFIVTEVVFILVPVKTGTLEIEPAVLQVGLLQRNRRPRPFSGMDAFFGRSQMTTRILETDPIAVHVKDLPPRPPGTSFSGLVGRFEIAASLDKTAIRVGDSTTLAVTVSGTGNIMDAPAPAIPAPNRIQDLCRQSRSADPTGPARLFGKQNFPHGPGSRTAGPIPHRSHRVDLFRRGIRRIPRHLHIGLSMSPSRLPRRRQPTSMCSGPHPHNPLRLKKRVEFTGRDILPLKEGLEAMKPQRSLPPLWFGLFLAHTGAGLSGCQNRRCRWPKRTTHRAESWPIGPNRRLNPPPPPTATDADFLSALYRALVSAILGTAGRDGHLPHLVGGQRSAAGNRVGCG